MMWNEVKAIPASSTNKFCSGEILQPGRKDQGIFCCIYISRITQPNLGPEREVNCYLRLIKPEKFGWVVTLRSQVIVCDLFLLM